MQDYGYGGPGKYVQGPGKLNELAAYAKPMADSAVLLVDGFVLDAYGAGLESQFANQDITVRMERFGGESTDAEVDRVAGVVREAGASLVIGIGGGKSLDAAKIAAFKTGSDIFSVPTIAATDAPTSSIGVIYSPEGVYDRVVRCAKNPDLVLVDSEVILRAPVRFLISGMGDALSTWYEARSNIETGSNNYIGTGYTATAGGYAIARACHETLYTHGRQAAADASAGKLTDAVEKIIETNILLSGLGFENCGVSAAHGIHDAVTVLEPTHHYFHGEKVAFGVIGLLVIEGRPDAEIDEALAFCLDLGLPVAFEDIGLAGISDADIQRVAEAAVVPDSVIHSTKAEINTATVRAAMVEADRRAQAARQARASA